MKDSFNRDIKYLRISVTELCNLRCQYCMPEEGIPKKSHESMLRNEDMVSIAKAAASLGIEKIRITGGEPLVKRGIVQLCKDISSINGIEELCLTTNGIMLENMAQPLKDAGVTRINLSLDTLKADKYKKITRTGCFEEFMKGYNALKEAKFDKVKINVVLIKGFNDDEIEDFVELTRNEDIEVRFIEMMPIGRDLKFDFGEYMPCEEVLKKVPELEGEEEVSGVAELYKLPDGEGRVGLIKPISCDFCESCNKIRITSDGKIKPCLHLEKEYNIKGLNFEEMTEVLKTAIFEKPERREELGHGQLSQAGRNMNQIGG